MPSYCNVYSQGAINERGTGKQVLINGVYSGRNLLLGCVWSSFYRAQLRVLRSRDSWIGSTQSVCTELARDSSFPENEAG